MADNLIKLKLVCSWSKSQRISNSCPRTLNELTYNLIISDTSYKESADRLWGKAEGLVNPKPCSAGRTCGSSHAGCVGDTWQEHHHLKETPALQRQTSRASCSHQACVLVRHILDSFTTVEVIIYLKVMIINWEGKRDCHMTMGYR